MPIGRKSSVRAFAVVFFIAGWQHAIAREPPGGEPPVTAVGAGMDRAEYLGVAANCDVVMCSYVAKPSSATGSIAQAPTGRCRACFSRNGTSRISIPHGTSEGSAGGNRQQAPSGSNHLPWPWKAA